MMRRRGGAVGLHIRTRIRAVAQSGRDPQFSDEGNLFTPELSRFVERNVHLEAMLLA